MDKNIVINITNVKQQFGKLIALNNINMNIKKGEIIGFLGPSGSGKTTLVKAIIGMLKPTSGKITVFGTEVPSLSIVDRIGYMAQADALYDDLNAYDNLLFFGSLYGLKGTAAKNVLMKYWNWLHLLNTQNVQYEHFQAE